jgi:pSer/pThr/pTyr-binding forkhead associated (FHA) protein
MWILRSAEADSGQVWSFRILPGTTKTVGRAVRADFAIDAALVSRVHCRLTSDAHGTLEVEDLHSTNGTFVNERPVKRARLVPGDRLRVGRVELMVERVRPGSVEDPETPPPPARMPETGA